MKPPTLVEAVFNRCFGWLVGVGLAPANFHLLEVQGRKSGRIFSTPVDLLRLDGQRYLVSPRGQTQWVRNARASGVVTLRQGRRAERYALREIGDEAKAAILRAYLDTFRRQVQRFFPVPAGSPEAAFVPLAARYPAFALRLES